MLTSRSEFLDLPDVRLHIRRWGDAKAPTLFLLHGWMDVSASFQFVVDALQRDWNIIAPDWRGFGPSDWLSRPYFFAEHIGDLEAILDRYAPKGKVRIAGHSMGGIIACLYAGIRPERIESLISLEGFGIAPHTPEMAPERYRQWLDTLQRPPRMHVYQDRAAFARRLQRGGKQLAQPQSHVRDGGHHRHAEPFGERARVDIDALAARFIDAVQRDDQRFAEQAEFERQFEVALQRRGVDHLDQHVGRRESGQWLFRLMRRHRWPAVAP